MAITLKKVTKSGSNKHETIIDKYDKNQRA
jgi:hypothetical protein